MKRASGVMTGFEDDDRWNNHNDDNAWGASRQEVDPTVFDAKEEAAMEAFVEEEVRWKLELGNMCCHRWRRRVMWKGGLDLFIYSFLAYTAHPQLCRWRKIRISA